MDLKILSFQSSERQNSLDFIFGNLLSKTRMPPTVFERAGSVFSYNWHHSSFDYLGATYERLVVIVLIGVVMLFVAGAKISHLQ